MANFHTHISVAGATGITLGTILCGSGLISTNQCLGLLAICILGGILPDIDSDSPSSISIISQIFAGVCAFLLILPFINKFAILITLGIFLLGYLSVRFGIITLISRLTQHRGIIHSIPFAILASLLTSIALFDLFGVTQEFAWIGAGFMLIGYLSHLVMDEISTQNLANEPIMRPHGKTLKLISFRSWILFLILYLIIVTSFFFTPNLHQATANILSTRNLHKVEHHLFSGSVPIDLEKYINQPKAIRSTTYPPHSHSKATSNNNNNNNNPGFKIKSDLINI